MTYSEQNNFGLDQNINGLQLMPYMAQLLEKNEKQEIEIERGKLSVSILKQMNNTSRLMIDAQKLQLKMGEFNFRQKKELEKLDSHENKK